MASQTIAETVGFAVVFDIFCILRGGVHKASNVRKCWLKHIQLYRLEKVGLKALLGARLENVGLKFKGGFSTESLYMTFFLLKAFWGQTYSKMSA